MTVNHYGISGSGDNSSIYNNTIIADPGYGTRIGGTENEIHHNIITLKSSGKNWFSGGEQEAIRLNDYCTCENKGIKVYANNITVYGKNDDFYQIQTSHLFLLSFTSGRRIRLPPAQ